VSRENTDSGRTQRAGVAHDNVVRAMLTLVALGPLALGGMHPSAMLVCAVVCLGIALGREAIDLWVRQWRRVPLASVALTALAIYTLFRGLPGSSFLGSEPGRQAAAAWGDLVARGSMAPGHAPFAAVTILAFAAALRFGAVSFHRSVTLARLAKAICLGGALVMAVGVVQHVVGATRVLGIYETVHLSRLHTPLSGPFVNGNQAAAFVGLCGVLSVVGAWRSDAPSARLAGVVLGLGAPAYVAALQGYGAAAALFAGYAVLGVSAFLIRAIGHVRAVRLMALVVGAGCAFVAYGAYVALPTNQTAVIPGVPQMTIQKAQLWNQALDMVGQAPVFGYGAGSFADVVPLFADRPVRLRHTFIEAAPLHVALDHGLLVVIAIFLVVAVPVTRWLWAVESEERGILRVGALALLAYVGVEAITGMGLNAFAMALPVSLLVGSVLGMQHARMRKYRATPSPLRVLPFALAPFFVAAIGLGGAPSAARDAAMVHGPLRHAGISVVTDAERDRVEELLSEAARRRPGAMRTHAEAALAFAALGDVERSQRHLEYLITCCRRYELTWLVANRLATIAQDGDAICASSRELLVFRARALDLDLVSDDPGAWLSCIPNRGPALAALYERLFAAQRPSDVLVIALRDLGDEASNVVSLRAALRAGRLLDIETSMLRYVDRLLLSPQAEPDDFVMIANTHIRQGDVTAALRALDLGITARPRAPQARFRRIELLLTLAARDAAPDLWIDLIREDLEATRTEALVNPSWTRQDRILRAEFALAIDDPSRARGSIEALLRDDPNDIAALRLSVRAAEARGDTAAEIAALQRLVAARPSDRHARRRLQALERGDLDAPGLRQQPLIDIGEEPSASADEIDAADTSDQFAPETPARDEIVDAEGPTEE